MAVAIKELMDMDVADRIDLALKLWESIPDKSINITISKSDEQELNNRYKEYQQNPNTGKSWEEIKSRLKYN